MDTLTINFIGLYELQNCKECEADKVWEDIGVGKPVTLKCQKCELYENKVVLAAYVKDRCIGVLPQDGKLEVVKKIIVLKKDAGLFDCTISKKGDSADSDGQLSIKIRIKTD